MLPFLPTAIFSESLRLGGSDFQPRQDVTSFSILRRLNILSYYRGIPGGEAMERHAEAVGSAQPSPLQSRSKHKH